MANYLDEEGLRKYNQLLQMKFIASGGSSGTGTNLMPGDNIDITDGVISVVTTDEVEQDNTKPVTSAAVYSEVGNINVLLKTI
jgi:hypothetical protein